MLPSLGITVFEFKFEFSLSLSLLILCVCPFHIANTLPPPPPFDLCALFFLITLLPVQSNIHQDGCKGLKHVCTRVLTHILTHSLSHTHSLTHSHTHTHSLTLTHTLTHSLSHTHKSASKLSTSLNDSVNTSVNKTHSYLGLVPTVMRPCQPHSMECLTDGMRKSLWIRLSMLCIPFRRNSARPTCNM